MSGDWRPRQLREGAPEALATSRQRQPRAKRARAVSPPAALERHNPNCIGGDIAGGSTSGLQLFFRPRIALDPWTIGDGLYLCSQSSPPGVGVHGMCGWHAANKALRHLA